MAEPFSHDRPLRREQSDADQPLQLPHRSDLLASIGALVNIWMSPRFQHALAAQITSDPDVPGLIMLRHLGFRGPLRPALLSQELGMTRSNVSKIVKRLEEGGLVERQDHEHDQRGVIVALTDAGATASRRAFEVGDKMADVVLADWAVGDVATLIRLVQQFTEGVRRYEDALPSVNSAGGE